MAQKDELPMCEGCMFCDPHSYTIEVDAFFLKVMRDALIALEDEAPDRSAPGWLKLCEMYIKEIEKKYKQKFDL